MDLAAMTAPVRRSLHHSRVMRKLVASLSLGSVVACSGGERAPAGATGARGGTAIVIAVAEPASIFPALIQDADGANVRDQLYERLAEIGDDLLTVGDRGFTPRLADRWTWAPDSLSIAFHVDPRARWHDGQPVRASDVKYSFDVVKDPKTNSSITSLVENVDSVTVRDPATAVAWFHTRRPEQFYDFVYQIYIVPEHVTGSVAHDRLATSPEIRRGIGSGPFRLVRWDAGQRVELVADTANPRGRATLDRLVYAIAPDAGAAMAQLLSGQGDILGFIPADRVAEVDSSRAARVVAYSGLQYAFLSFNVNDPKAPSRPHPIFGDRAVRRALSMAIDRRHIVENVFAGRAHVSHGPFPASLGVADTTLKLLPYDTAAANRLLDSAGWHAATPGGIRAKNGRPLRFAIQVPVSSRPRMAMTVLVQQALRDVGAQVDVEQLQGAAMLQHQIQHDYDAALIGVGIDPSPGGYRQQWGSAGAAKGGQNWGNYRNPAYDALLDSALASFDPAKTRALMRRAFEIQIADAPAVWLYDVPTFAGVHRRIQPASIRADAWWAHLDRWSIPPAQRIDRDRIGLGAPR